MSNRVIKFRAWDKSECQMTISETLPRLMAQDSLPECWIKGMVFLQFTGLHDKNGVEVYEGDILSSPHFVDSAGREHKLNHIVQWSDKFQSWFLLNTSTMSEKEGSVQMWLANGVEVTVIGNIYENPELLQGE